MFTSTSHLHRFFNRAYLACFVVLSVGVPLLFSSMTRSVFEVNKLLLIRIVLIVVYGLWLTKSLILRDNNMCHEPSKSYSLFGLRWRRIGLEIPILLWILSNLFSILLSDNIFISLIGAYDRWEGLATILNYILLFYMMAKLIDNTRYRLIIFCLCLFSTSLSGIYGIIQSLGVDFMKWSASPTARVFACINNPVHFCAYVAMIVPIGLSLSHFFLKRSLTHTAQALKAPYTKPLYITLWCAIVALSFIITFQSFSFAFLLYFILMAALGILCYRYDQLLPGRSLSLGIMGFAFLFVAFIVFDAYVLDRFQTTALIFGTAILFCCRVIHKRSLFLYRLCLVTTLICFYAMLLSFSRATIIGFVICASYYFQLVLHPKDSPHSLSRCIMLFFAVVFTQICLIFKLHVFGTMGIAIEIVALALSFVLLFFSSSTPSKSLFSTSGLASITLFSLTCLSFIITQALWAYAGILLFLYFFKKHLSECFLKNTLCMALILNLLFYFSTITGILGFCMYLSLLIYHVLYKNQETHERRHFIWLFVGMGLLMFLPLAPVLKDAVVSNIQYFQKGYHSTTASDSLAVANNMKARMIGVSSSRARLYMWLSVPGWLFDYPLFGSGPDTIRQLYPRYRHPQYGIHEGGHNFTPDRLHNEYLNTLVTNGLIGFSLKYIFFIGGWYIILLRLLIKHRHSENYIILCGILVGPSIYMVQILFNFGVVATLFLFYFLTGIGLSFVNDEYKDHVTSS